jgi:hypothetical protein
MFLRKAQTEFSDTLMERIDELRNEGYLCFIFDRIKSCTLSIYSLELLSSVFG